MRMSIAATLLAALVNLSVAQHNPDTRHYFANKHESTFEKKYKIDIYGAFSKKELDELGAYVEKARNKVPALETGFVLAKHPLVNITYDSLTGKVTKGQTIINYSWLRNNNIGFYDSAVDGRDVVLIDDIEHYDGKEYGRTLVHEIAHVVLSRHKDDHRKLAIRFYNINEEIKNANISGGRLEGYVSYYASGRRYYEGMLNSLWKLYVTKIDSISCRIDSMKKTLAAMNNSLKTAKGEEKYRLLEAIDKTNMEIEMSKLTLQMFEKLISQRLIRIGLDAISTPLNLNAVDEDIAETIEYYLTDQTYADKDTVVQKKVRAVKEFLRSTQTNTSQNLFKQIK